VGWIGHNHEENHWERRIQTETKAIESKVPIERWKGESRWVDAKRIKIIETGSLWGDICVSVFKQ
jgi:hypothetical protein